MGGGELRKKRRLQFDAMVSLAFNYPASLKDGSDLVVRDFVVERFTYTVFQGSRIDGLVTRRNNELNLFFNADYEHYYDIKKKVIDANIEYISYSPQ